MDTTERTGPAKISALSLCFTVTLAAHAAPPPVRETAPAPRLPHLDLRAPSMTTGDSHPFHGFIEFPAARHRDSGVERASPNEDFIPSQIKPMSGIQTLADRFHREGMPVARLWENHAALVSVGLNQRGKPGVWLIQKTR